MEPKITIYMFEKNSGGEYIWFERIARKIGAEIQFFWKEDGKGPNILPSGILNYLVYYLTKLLVKIKPDLSRGIYGLFGISTYKIQEKSNEISIMSSTHVPIPRGKRLIAYIHTPSRLMTIGLKSEIEKRRNSLRSTLFLTLWKNIYYCIYRVSIQKIECVLSNSNNTKDRLKKYLKVDSTVLYPSVDIEHFYTGEIEKFFFYPSRISPQKRQLMALEAFCEFYKCRTDFKLIFATTSLKSKENRDYLENLKEYANLHSLPIEIKEGLTREELINFYSRAYACLFSGIDEDFGQIPLESQAASKPVIAIKEGGTLETIEDGKTGYLVSNASEMAEKMLRLAKSDTLTKSMGETGRKHVEEKFSDEVFINNLKDVIKRHISD